MRSGEYVTIINTSPVSNNTKQWIGCELAAYPVQGIHMDYAMLAVLWEMDPDRMDSIIDEHQLDHLKETMENADAETGTLAERISFITEVEGWRVFSETLRDHETGEIHSIAHCVRASLLSPCTEKGKHMSLIPCGVEGWLLVYSGAKLAGLVSTADKQKTESIIERCREVGAMKSW